MVIAQYSTSRFPRAVTPWNRMPWNVQQISLPLVDVTLPHHSCYVRRIPNPDKPKLDPPLWVAPPNCKTSYFNGMRTTLHPHGFGSRIARPRLPSERFWYCPLRFAVPRGVSIASHHSGETKRDPERNQRRAYFQTQTQAQSRLEIGRMGGAFATRRCGISLSPAVGVLAYCARAGATCCHADAASLGK